MTGSESCPTRQRIDVILSQIALIAETEDCEKKGKPGNSQMTST
jgi:hypothetical protein